MACLRFGIFSEASFYSFVIHVYYIVLNRATVYRPKSSNSDNISVCKLSSNNLFIASLYYVGYLTASKYGLDDGEIEDVLSLDDDVLQDTYLYHLPPNDTMI